jgi:hypothetical protein
MKYRVTFEIDGKKISEIREGEFKTEINKEKGTVVQMWFCAIGEYAVITECAEHHVPKKDGAAFHGKYISMLKDKNPLLAGIRMCKATIEPVEE